MGVRAQEGAFPYHEPRALLSNREGAWNGIEFVAASEDISSRTVWHLKADVHSVVVHLGGAMGHFESAVEGGHVTVAPPSPGEIWLVPAGFRYMAEAQGERVRYGEFRVPAPVLRDLAGEGAPPVELNPRLALSDEFIYQQVRQLERVVGEADDLSRMFAETLSLGLAYHLLRSYAVDSARPKDRTGFAKSEKRLLDKYINDNLGQPIPLDDLAALVGRSTHGLLRGFRASFDTTPAQFIIARRIATARRLLSHGRLDITSIAMATGFSSHSHLSTTFKRVTGMTPQAFRREFR